ncbi:MAG: ammonia-forming cytochrome c nitrite reductase subunit c552 [Polyangiales bacterium]
MMIRAQLVISCLAPLVALSTSCSKREPAAPKSAPEAVVEVEATYVGSEQCASCHEEVHDAWLGSHHDLAMQAATPETVLGDFNEVTATYFQERVRFAREGERFFIEALDADGKTRRFEVAYTFGVSPLQQYLVETDPGRFQAFAFAWDTRPKTDGGQRWFHLQPDEYIGPADPLHWTGLRYNWNQTCADCHSTRLIKGYDRTTRRYTTTYEEVNVGCEACHGPGSRHVSLAKSSDMAPAGFDVPLVAPSARDWHFVDDRDIAVLGSSPETAELQSCAPCHSRRSDIDDSQLAYHDRYRLAALDEALYFDDGQIKDEVYVYGSFLQSKMYAAGVVCSDCHDPHTAALRAEGNTLCTTCHKAEVYDTGAHSFHAPGDAGSACTDCHMPKRTYMGIDERGDHRFGVPMPALSARVGAPDPCTECHVKKSATWAQREIDKRFEVGSVHAFADALHSARNARPEGEAMLAEIIATSSAPAVARASAIIELANLRSRALPALLMRASNDSSPVVRRSVAVASRVLPIELRAEIAKPLLSDPTMTVRIEAAAVLLEADQAGWGGDDRRALADAKAEYRRARTFGADRAEGLTDLANLELVERRPAQAEAILREALEVDPSFTAAYVNLADLYRILGKGEESEGILREALESAADQATASHALGLALVRVGKRDEALAALGRAYDLRPEAVRFGYVYAVAMFDGGRREAALDLLEKLRSRYPADTSVLMALVTYNQKLGRDDEAMRHAKTLQALGVRPN